MSEHWELAMHQAVETRHILRRLQPPQVMGVCQVPAHAGINIPTTTWA
jgi:hypothetical protein